MTTLRITQDAVDQLEKILNGLLWLIGYDPRGVLVTDLSTFLDFLDMFTYPKLEDVTQHVNELLKTEGLDIQVCGSDTLTSVAIRISNEYPNWPSDSSSKIVTIH